MSTEPNTEFEMEEVETDKTADQEASSSGTKTETSEDGAAFRMQLGKEEIERMINDGTLEKVSEGYYRVKADSMKDLKIAGKPLPNILPKTISMSPLSKKAQTMSALNLSAVGTSAGQTTPVMIQNLQGNSTLVQPQGSYIALMPVSSQANSSAILAAQSNPNFNPNIPTFVAVTQTAAPSIAGVGTTNVVTASAGPSNTRSSSKIQTRSSSQLPSTSQAPSTQSTPPSTAATTTTAGPSSSKRKPQFEDTKVKRPYKYARPMRKAKKAAKAKNYVSDFNTSEEDDDERVESKAVGTQLASMFFRKIGEPKKQNKSLLDKLHKSIFEDTLSNTESETEEESELEEEANNILSEKTSCQMATCPGPGKIETYVGPGKNSKLTIIRSHETKMIKNFLYEVYKVRVASAGREANTNILIPIPEGYKFQYPTRSNEEAVEFSHLPHKDGLGASFINPKFLEELAATKLKLRKYKDAIKVLRGRYLELLQEYANRPQFSTLSDLVGAAAKFLTEDQLVFFLMQLKAGAHNMQGIRYSVREKVLALSIYQKSPDMYKWFRKLFSLPSKRTLDQWLEGVGNQDPQLLKKLMYHVYTAYNYKPVS